MSAGLIIVIGVLEAAIISAVLFLRFSKTAGLANEGIAQLDAVVAERQQILVEMEQCTQEMVDIESLRAKGRELSEVSESLKAERGRNTITQAELETVEARLRELEEIERELEASGIETKEELKILGKKQKELTQKNETLKAQIEASLAQLTEVMSQMEMSAELTVQIDTMKTQLVMTQQKIDTLLTQIEEGNDQYFILKNRYDALDIEYAQLFEKFSESEAAIASKKG